MTQAQGNTKLKGILWYDVAPSDWLQVSPQIIEKHQKCIAKQAIFRKFLFLAFQNCLPVFKKTNPL